LYLAGYLPRLILPAWRSTDHFPADSAATMDRGVPGLETYRYGTMARA
jgi:hypothetical protein